MTDDILDSIFHGCALKAYLEVWAETRQFPPDSEATRQRAFRLYEEALAEKNRRKHLQGSSRTPLRGGRACPIPASTRGHSASASPCRLCCRLPLSTCPCRTIARSWAGRNYVMTGGNSQGDVCRVAGLPSGVFSLSATHYRDIRRPDSRDGIAAATRLTEQQAWQILQHVERQLDSQYGVTWDTLETAAEDLFGPAPETAAEEN